MIIKRAFMLTLIVLISCTEFNVNSKQKSSKKGKSAIILNQGQNIPSSWHKVDTDKFYVSFPGGGRLMLTMGLLLLISIIWIQDILVLCKQSLKIPIPYTFMVNIL